MDDRGEAQGSLSVHCRDRRYRFGQAITVGPVGARVVPTVSSVTLRAVGGNFRCGPSAIRRSLPSSLGCTVPRWTQRLSNSPQARRLDRRRGREVRERQHRERGAGPATVVAVRFRLHGGPEVAAIRRGTMSLDVTSRRES